MNNSEMNSISAVQEFVHANNLQDYSNTVIPAFGFVEYNHHEISELKECNFDIFIDNFNYGQIGIDQNVFNANTHHTSFTPKFQKMEFISNANKLKISGNSNKMGNYSVLISFIALRDLNAPDHYHPI